MCESSQPEVRGRLTRYLGVGLLGSGMTTVLASSAVVVGIALGIFVGCLVVGAVHVLRRASRRIDRIMTEELDQDIGAPGRRYPERWRRTA
jgi:hypothetical protein